MIRSTKAASKNKLSTKIVPDRTACPGSEKTFIYFERPEKSGKMALWLRRGFKAVAGISKFTKD